MTEPAGPNKSKKLQVKLAIDRDYAESVFPWLKRLFMKETMAGIFQLSLSLLVYHAEALEKNHQLVEVDESGKMVGIVRIPEYVAGQVRERLSNEKNRLVPS